MPPFGVAYGDPPFTISTTSDSPGLVTYTIVSGPATVTGSTITITGVGVVSLVANQAATGIYDTATASMSFGIGAGTAAITLAANSSSTTVSAGGTATFYLTLIPVKTFLNNITLSVSGLPTGATAAFSPPTIAAGSGSTPVTLSIQTSTQTARVDHLSRTGFETIALGLVLLPLAGFKPNRRLASSLVAIAVLSLGTLLTGCSSGTSGSSSTTTTTPKSFPLVITAKDTIIGSQISGNLTLTVQ